MGLLDKLKSLLGRDDRQTRRRQSGSTNVTVEHEPEPEPASENEAAVKGTDEADDHTADGAGAATRTDAATGAGSTAQPDEQGTQAGTEPAEPSEPEAATAEVEGAEPSEPEAATAEVEGAEPSEPDEPGDADSEEPVDSINGIGPTYAERLEAADIGTVGDLAATDAETIADVAEAAESRATDWLEQAQNR